MPQENPIPVDSIIEIASHTDISRHTPGRIKLVLRPSGFKLIEKINLNEALSRMPGVLDIRPSLLTRSVEVDYDQNILPYDLWEYLVRLKGKPEVETKIKAYLQALGNRLGSHSNG